MKRERFVDMEAFSRSIMPCLHGIVAKLFARPPDAGMSAKAPVAKAPDLEQKIGSRSILVKLAQTKTALHGMRTRSWAHGNAWAKQAPVRKTNPALWSNS